MSIEEDLRRALMTHDATSGWPDPVRRVEAGIRRRVRRRRIAAGLGLAVLLGFAVPTVLLATRGPSGLGSIVAPAARAPAPARDLNPYALLFAGLFGVAGLWFANRPVRASTLERFRRRHGLVAPASPTLIAYLAIRRRWRVLAITAAVIAELLSSTAGSVDVRFAVLAGALLAGALAAELRFRLLITAANSGSRPPVPWLLTATLGGVLALALVIAIGIPRLATITPSETKVWAAVAGGAVLATGAGIHLIASQGWQRGGSDEATAIATSGMHSLAAYGVAAALLCLAQALHVASEQMLNWTALAVGSLAWIWGLAACVLALALWRAGWPRATATRWSDPRVKIAALWVVTLSVSAGLVVHGKLVDRPPFEASAVHPRATVIVSDYEHYAAAAAALGTTGTQPEIVVALPLIYVRVDIDTPAETCDGCFYYCVLIDGLTNIPARNAFGPDGITWGYPLNQVPRQFPWLSALTADNGGAVTAPAGQSEPIVFTADFTGMPVSADRLVAALILVGPDEQIYWATRVPVTPLELPA